MLDKYDGDVEKALAAYNAGPGSLDSVNGDISQLSGETQKYVPSVMERYNKFKNKSGGGISSSGNILDWDSTNEDFSKLDFFPKDGEQSQGTVNEFLENLAKLEESKLGKYAYGGNLVSWHLYLWYDFHVIACGGSITC